MKKAHMSTVLNVNIYALSVHLIIPLLFNPTIGLFIYSYSIYICNNSNYRVFHDLWTLLQVVIS